jgi:hypothetical protein
MSLVTTFMPFLVVWNSNTPFTIGFISPWNYNNFSDTVMIMGGGLPATSGTEVVSCWTPFSPVETLSSSSIRRGAKRFRVGIAGDFIATAPLPWTRCASLQNLAEELFFFLLRCSVNPYPSDSVVAAVEAIGVSLHWYRYAPQNSPLPSNSNFLCACVQQ